MVVITDKRILVSILLSEHTKKNLKSTTNRQDTQIFLPCRKISIQNLDSWHVLDLILTSLPLIKPTVQLNWIELSCLTGICYIMLLDCWGHVMSNETCWDGKESWHFKILFQNLSGITNPSKTSQKKLVTNWNSDQILDGHKSRVILLHQCLGLFF
jgi:hypothetical protein